MSDVIITVTDTSLSRLLQESEVPVLVDLWAVWCQPCLALAPLLEKVAASVGNNLVIAKLDVDQYPESARQLRVRGIPTLLLFSKGKEVSRKIGVDSLSDLSHWLRDNGVPLESEEEKVSWQAGLSNSFYGDAELTAFFTARLKREACAQRIASYWQIPLEQGKLPLSAALVKQENPAVFTNVTGLPAAVGEWLNFLDYSTPEHAEQLADVLLAGKDLSLLPLHLIATWLQDSRTQWDVWLAAEVNQLRQRWLALALAYLNGEETPRKSWLALHEAIQSLQQSSQHDEYSFEHYVMLVLGELSPPPLYINDGASQETSIYAICEAQTRIEQMVVGWTQEDRQQFKRRELWLNEQLLALSGKQSEQAYDELLARWSEAHQAFVVKEQDFDQRQTALLKAAFAPLRAHCLRLLRDAPVVEAAA